MIKTEVFPIPGNIRARFLGTYNYSLRTLIPYIIQHYASGYPEYVRERIIRASQKEPMYRGLIRKIQRLNMQILIAGSRIILTSNLTIPTAYIFFRSFFPVINVTLARQGTIRLKTCPNGVLDQFHYAIELENIVGHPDRTIAFTDLTESSQKLIKDALHTFRIYTAPNAAEGEQEPDEEELNHYISAAIKVFEGEGMERLPDYRTGMIDSELLMEMNAALLRRWHREQYFEGVHHVAPFNTRYFIRQGVVPIVPRFNQQGVALPERGVIGPAHGQAWGNRRIPRLYNQDVTPQEERLMESHGCAVALVANIAHTHRERLIAAGTSPATLSTIIPRTIINNESNVVGQRYFDNHGNIFWSEPLRTLIRPLRHNRNDPNFADPEMGGPGSLSVERFNRLMASTDNYYYVIINVNTTGQINNNSTTDHWVGASELVIRPATGTGIDAQFFRISPTSQFDWDIAHQDGTLTERGQRGWQREGNNVYVPVDQLRGRFRIITLP